MRLEDLHVSQPWRRHAACHGQTALFFVGRGHHGQTDQAKALCAACPVLEPCREYALTSFDTGVEGGGVGFIAGMSVRDRRHARRERTAA